MFKFLFKFIVYSTIIVLMLFVSTEATKISRDKARLKNAHILSQSIQYYKMIHGAFPTELFEMQSFARGQRAFQPCPCW